MDPELDPISCDYTYGLISGVAAEYKDLSHRLRNTQRSALFMSVDGFDIDNVDPSISGFPSTGDAQEGQALMLDGAILELPDADIENDDGGNWCTVADVSLTYEVVFAEENIGTPGAVNPSMAAVCP
jgi:hypothetical protein